MLKALAAIAINTLAGLAFHAGRIATATLRAGRAEFKGDAPPICVVTPLEPSDRSGGGKAVKELVEVLGARLTVRVLALSSVIGQSGAIARIAATLLAATLPAQVVSIRCLLAPARVRQRLRRDEVVFVEFSEGASFLAFRARLPNFTILRDHEFLLRRFSSEGQPSGGSLESLRNASARYACRAFLRNVYAKADRIVVLTEEDRTAICRDMGLAGAKVVVVPVSFRPPLSTHRERTDVTSETTRDLLFLGNLYHPPNVEGLLWFLRECATHLSPGFRLHLCGIDTPLDHIRLPRTGLKIVRHGFLEDIEAKLAAVRIGVSPVVSGGGTRMKNLYLGATGRLVVTTSLGNEGIDLVDGREAIVRDDGVSMAAAINDLPRNPERIDRLGKAAALRIAAMFSPDAVWTMYRDHVLGGR
jgi:glycosyltransferase involved in cell wall biosynthesis